MDVSCLLQPCIFRIDYVLENINREFGSVFVGTTTPPENVAMSVVQAGWAKVSPILKCM
jgi:hypothetical protein